MPSPLESRFVAAGRRRPVALVVPGSRLDEVRAPYAAATAPVEGAAQLALPAGDDVLRVVQDGRAAWLEVETAGRTTAHRSRRHARTREPVRELGLTLTGTHVTAFTRGDGPWVARARMDLRDRVDTRDEEWLAALAAGAPRTGGAAGPATAGRFGQLGLRDLRVVTDTGGSAYRPDGRVLLTATSAGPGFFDTAHTSVWALEPGSLELEHLSDLWFRRPGRPGAYGDHATHLVRDGDGWLVATSTWGDFDHRRPGAGVTVTLAETGADLLRGAHLLDTRPLVLPTDGLASVGVWDPHLVRTGDGWLVGYVSATRWFRFHPVVATGPALSSLSLRAAATDRVATEGTTLVRAGGRWLVLASDGRDGRRGQRQRYPAFDLDLHEVGELAAPYPSNIPWPTLVDDGSGWLLVGFDGTAYGGRLPGYGTHGDVVFARAGRPTTV